ncbi:hypothetical protein Scep_017124 [Stephania cephalantha]|uniref:Uncharacterized protein n=1 Tax=Stephania cephalantha TaxID=152367 RepID=A0AAP0INZ8_9MAGN
MIRPPSIVDAECHRGDEIQARGLLELKSILQRSWEGQGAPAWHGDLRTESRQTVTLTVSLRLEVVEEALPQRKVEDHREVEANPKGVELHQKIEDHYERVGRDPSFMVHGRPTEPYFRWDPLIDEAIVKATYDAKAYIRYDELMHELRALGVRSGFITDEAWNRYCEYWASTDFKARSEKVSHNRKNEKGGPGTGLSKHTGGTRSFQTYEDILLVRRRQEHTQATPDQAIDEEQPYYDVVEVYPKRRVYGLKSIARKKRRYADLGASTSQQPMVRRSEFGAIVQRLAQF